MDHQDGTALLPDRLTGLPAASAGDDLDEWTEEEIVFLHWRLLQELVHLGDPATPLAEKFDTLRWVFTEHEKDVRPFSFVSCLHVVTSNLLSPIDYCGRVDPYEIRCHIERQARAWMRASVERYPAWVRQAVAANPVWVEQQLALNPQWLNEQAKRVALEGDLFA
jgi:hypothetical protein